MTRTAIFAVVLLAFAATSVAAGADAQRPQLGVADRRPLVVEGRGFEARERVQVLLVLNGKQHWERTVATRAGSFRVEFAVSLGRCARFTVRAMGARGSRAVLLPLRAVRPDCESPTSATT